jgi:predicted ester cyclase
LEITLDNITSRSEQLITNYISALAGEPRTSELIDRFVSDAALKKHILDTDAAFPNYQVKVSQMIAQGDTVALRGVFHGIHNGSFAGIEPTGRNVSADLMIFYRIEGNHIAEHWMQFDFSSLMGQLTGQPVAD